MPKEAENPFKMGHDPELDTCLELDPNTASYSSYYWHPKVDDQIGENEHNNRGVTIVIPYCTFQGGTFRSSNTFHGPTGQRHNSRLVYDPLYPEIDLNVFKNVIGQISIGMPMRLYP